MKGSIGTSMSMTGKGVPFIKGLAKCKYCKKAIKFEKVVEKQVPKAKSKYQKMHKGDYIAFMKKINTKWVALNLDGSKHFCKRKITN